MQLLAIGVAQLTGFASLTPESESDPDSSAADAKQPAEKGVPGRPEMISFSTRQLLRSIFCDHTRGWFEDKQLCGLARDQNITCVLHADLRDHGCGVKCGRGGRGNRPNQPRFEVHHQTDMPADESPK